jgi:DNA-binding NtrC family response regulator
LEPVNLAAPVSAALKSPMPQFYCSSEVRILVLGNEAAVCESIRVAVAPLDLRVDTVWEVDRIEAQLRTTAYHLILIDDLVPGIAPEMLFEWLHNQQPNAGIIVITGHLENGRAMPGLRERAVDYLARPFHIGQLRDVVQRCLESKGLVRVTEEALRESLGRFIRQRRKALRLTLAAMAERTRVSLGYLSQIELGKNSASIETLYRICLGLGIRMSELFLAIRS